jgi:mono/diheme cytochrome c family protein
MNIRYQGTSFAHLGKKLLSCSSLLFCFGLLSSFASAQLPELESPSTATGTSTTAKFFGGATADNSDTFGSSFRGDQPLDIFVEIQVESDHINTVGNVYLLIQLGADIFMRLPSGEYVIWDQTLNSLQATLQGRTLQASEPITILENVAFGSAGLSGASLAIFVAYDTIAASDELYYSGMPLSFSILSDTAPEIPEVAAVAAAEAAAVAAAEAAAEAAAVAVAAAEAAANPASQTFYLSNISGPIVQTKCLGCHKTTGSASYAGLNYVNSSVDGFQQTNYSTLLDYIKNVPGGASLILSKPRGLVAHGGGMQLSRGTAEFDDWSTLVATMINEVGN